MLPNMTLAKHMLVGKEDSRKEKEASP